MKTWKPAALIAAAAMAVLGANADESAPPACPENAATELYQIASAAAQTTDPAQLNNAHSHATRFVLLCPKDPFVQFFAADAFAQVASRIADPSSRLQALEDSTRAFLKFDSLPPDPVTGGIFHSGLHYADGSEATVDTLTSGNILLRDIIVPQIVELEARSQFHDFIAAGSKTRAPACPYKAPSRAAAEAAGYHGGFETIAIYFLNERSTPNPLGAIQRLEWLREACPEASAPVTFELARLWAQAAHWYESLDNADNTQKTAEHAIDWLTRYKALVEDGTASPGALASANRLLADMEALRGE
ncbi:hypothetical protein [uncultured Hyphomonas sp.]|uniref:hypothetical protein n=1 Tax=uncultured Hyphomonas sp. TaxID=225298 RepID=UPI002AAB7732|nr:hypothetical protein [uncultured Hyphomonas sp.]